MNHIKVIVLFLITGNFMMLHAKNDQDTVLSQEVITRAVLSSGDETRLYHLFEKAKLGEPVTIGVIGGSICRIISVHFRMISIKS